MREADFDCAPHSACYDSALPGGGAAWGWPELLLVILAVILLLGLISLLLQPAEKPKPTLREAVRKIMNDNATAAQNWGDPEAAGAFRRAGDAIEKEFTDRNVT